MINYEEIQGFFGIFFSNYKIGIEKERNHPYTLKKQ